MIHAQPALRRSGLTARVGLALERRRAGGAGGEPETAPDGLPVPPPLLRVQNVNSPDLDYFFARGGRTAQSIAEASERHGLPMSDVNRLLDFGCGCGRVLRQWHAYPGVEPWGSDLSVAATSWVRSNLPFVNATANGLAPPLAHVDEMFDLIYSISVFTHLPEDLGRAWMNELRRVLRPGGLLMFTVHGERYAPYLTRAERAAFDRGELVVQFADAAGANICCAYHPESYVRRLTEDFEQLEVVAAQSLDCGTENAFAPQNLWIVRRPTAS
jgi:SAM-dependent methyltransferase